MTRTERHRTLDILGIVTLIVTVVMLGLLIVGVLTVFDTRDETSAVAEGNEQAACRGQYRAKVDESMGVLVPELSDLMALTNAGLEAVVDENDEVLAEVTRRSPIHREAVQRASANLRAAIIENASVARLAVEDPTGFADLCADN